MKDVLLIYIIIFNCIFGIVLGSSEEDYHSEYYSYSEHSYSEYSYYEDSDDYRQLKFKVPSSCWMTLNAADHFKVLDEIDARYAKIREGVQNSLKENDFDESMIEGFKRERGVALREVNANHPNMWTIPSGLNLGGMCMLRMPDSILFFHRMKLRNNTHFRVDYLHNELSNMMVRMHLSLNDLHLMGAYERSLTEPDPSILIYSPTYGEVEFLMKDVKYKVEGRYRLIKNRLLIELITSEINVDDILMTYVTKVIESTPLRVDKGHLGNFMGRLKSDLDEWLKDYFNDYLIYAEMDGIPHMDELSKYDKEKETALEEFSDHAIHAIGNRIRRLNGKNINLPSFTFRSVHGLQIKLYEGVLYGLDSMYRRSVATGFKQRGNVRRIDSIVGFSNLKVVYSYEAMIPTGVPPLAGVLTLSANELTAHLALAVVLNPETVDLDIEFRDQLKPESLTIEGAANIMIANFKHLLEHQIVAVMSNTLIHGVDVLKSLPTCEPFLPGLVPERKGKHKTKNPRQRRLEHVETKHIQKRDKNKNKTNLKNYKRKSKKVASQSKTTLGNKN